MKNPLWLTDRGDKFFTDGDYYSAINAYTAAIKLDKDMIRPYANRSACQVKLFNFLECIDDCEAVMDFMHNLKVKQKYDIKNMSMYTKARIREAIAQAWQGELDRAKDRLETVMRLCNNGDPYLDPISLEDYERKVKLRQEKEAEKKKRDEEIAKMEGQARMAEMKDRVQNNFGPEAAKKAMEEQIKKQKAAAQGEPAKITGKIVESNEKYDVVEEGPNQYRYIPKEPLVDITGKNDVKDDDEKDNKEGVVEETGDKVKKTLEEIQHEAIIEFRESEFAKNIVKSIEKDLEFIENRKLSVKQKMIGDKYFEEGFYDKAIDSYNKALEIDCYNEKALSNLALIVLKKNDYDKTVELCTKALNIILPLLEKNHFSANMIQSSCVSISLICKIYLRRAQAKFSLKKLDDAKDDIRNLLLLDERNEQARK